MQFILTKANPTQSFYLNTNKIGIEIQEIEIEHNSSQEIDRALLNSLILSFMASKSTGQSFKDIFFLGQMNLLNPHKMVFNNLVDMYKPIENYISNNLFYSSLNVELVTEGVLINDTTKIIVHYNYF